MATVTLWLSIASGGRFRSSGMSRPLAWAPPAQRRSRERTGKGRRMEAPLSENVTLPHPDYANVARRMREKNRLRRHRLRFSVRTTERGHESPAGRRERETASEPPAAGTTSALRPVEVLVQELVGPLAVDRV